MKKELKKKNSDLSLCQIPDWDDRIHVIQWVDVEAPLDNTRANSVTTVTTATNNKEKAHIDK